MMHYSLCDCSLDCLIDLGTTIRNNRSGGEKFSVHEFFFKARLSAGIFSRAYDLLFLGITTCRSFFLRQVSFAGIFLGNCHSTSGFFQWSGPNRKHNLISKEVNSNAKTTIMTMTYGRQLFNWSFSSKLS